MVSIEWCAGFSGEHEREVLPAAAHEEPLLDLARVMLAKCGHD
jgi:hypothetical protein